MPTVFILLDFISRFRVNGFHLSTQNRMQYAYAGEDGSLLIWCQLPLGEYKYFTSATWVREMSFFCAKIIKMNSVQWQNVLNERLNDCEKCLAMSACVAALDLKQRKQCKRFLKVKCESEFWLGIIRMKSKNWRWSLVRRWYLLIKFRSILAQDAKK